MQERIYYIYLMANKSNQIIYVGVTNNLIRRAFEHREKKIKGFTEKYNLTKLVYFEDTTNVMAAIGREKEIKKWRREKKNKLIEAMNPDWEDLAERLWGGLEIS